MARHRLHILLPLLVFTAACASIPPQGGNYWDKPGGNAVAFDMDNQHCGAEATRRTPNAREDRPPSSMVAPRNRIDRPPLPYANGVTQQAYMDCMASEGWRLSRP
jgi:hypothetical protein